MPRFDKAPCLTDCVPPADVEAAVLDSPRMYAVLTAAEGATVDLPVSCRTSRTPPPSRSGHSVPQPAPTSSASTNPAPIRIQLALAFRLALSTFLSFAFRFSFVFFCVLIHGLSTCPLASCPNQSSLSNSMKSVFLYLCFLCVFLCFSLSLHPPPWPPVHQWSSLLVCLPTASSHHLLSKNGMTVRMQYFVTFR